MKSYIGSRSALLVAGAIALSVSATNPAQANIFGGQKLQQWDMCNWESIPDHVLRRIGRRSDFDEILLQMFDNCPDSALGLTDRPTASISDGNSDGDRVNGPDGFDDGPGNPPSANPPSDPPADPPADPPSDPEDPGDPPGDDNPPAPDFGLPG